MTSPPTPAPAEPGWYRLTAAGWERVAPVGATVADVAGRFPRCELVLVEAAGDGEQVSLW